MQSSQELVSRALAFGGGEPAEASELLRWRGAGG